MGKRGADEPDRRSSANPPGLSDGTLIAEFNSLRDELVSTLAYLLGNKDDALDCAQETFLKCWRARESAEGVQNLRAWIFRVGLNAAKDMQRSAWNRRVKQMSTEEIMIAAPESHLNMSLDDQESLRRLREAIVELGDSEKEVFLLRQNGNLTYEQIAEIRHAPVGTVKTQMRSALMKLKKVLKPR